MSNDTKMSNNTKKGYYKYSWNILGLVWFAFAVDVFMRYNIPTVIPILRQEYNWDATTVGWVDSSYLWAYAIMQVPWGYLSEKKLGPKWTIFSGTLLITGASILFAFNVDSLGIGIFARAIIGAGAAAIWVPANPMIARWFGPNKKGLSLGILGTGSPVGQFLGGSLMPVLVLNSVAIFGLSQIQSGFLWSVIPGLLLIIIIPMFLKNRPEDIGFDSLDKEKNEDGVTVLEGDEKSFGYIMTHSWYPYLLGIIYAGYLGALYFVWTFFSAYLVSSYGINIKSAGIYWAIASTLPALVSQPLAGWLSDRIGKKRTTIFALLSTASVATIIGISAIVKASFVLTMILVLIFAIFVNMWVVVWTFTTTMFSTKAAGPIGGFMNTLAQLIGASAPVVSGLFIDKFDSYVPIFMLGAVCAFIGFICSFFLKEKRVI